MTLVHLNAFLAIFVFAGAAGRLACLPAAIATFKARAVWLAWLWSHVLIGVGAFAVMCAPFLGEVPGRGGTTLVLTGMAAYFGLNWLHRSEGGSHP